MKNVSIIITCYNYGQYLSQCVNSVLHQTYKGEIEIIIVDDKSDDEETIKQLVEMSKHCRVVWHSERRGLAAASNTGVAVAKGELVMRLDADDWLSCEHIELLEKNITSSIGAAYSDYWKYENGREIDSAKVFTQSKIPHGSCMLFRRELWEKVGGYDEILKHQEDVEFFKRIEKLTDFYHLCIPTWYYRKHGKQMSNAYNARMKVRQKVLNEPKILTVIPARGNSKEVENKNLQVVGGMTLIERAIKIVKDSGITTTLVVSSEDDDILGIAIKEGVDWIKRQKYLSEDNISTIPVVIHALKIHEDQEESSFDIVISVQPTCPFTPPKALAEGVEKLKNDNNLDSVVCISEVRKHPYRTYFPTPNGLLYPCFPEESERYLQRQDRPKTYGFTGGFYIRQRELLNNWDGKGFALGNCSGIEVNQTQGIDIDTETDLLIAKHIAVEKCW